MAVTASTYYTLHPYSYPTADGDPIEPTTQVYAFFLAHELHDHSGGQGKPIVPASLSGDVLKRIWHFAVQGD